MGPIGSIEWELSLLAGKGGTKFFSYFWGFGVSGSKKAGEFQNRVQTGAGRRDAFYY